MRNLRTTRSDLTNPALPEARIVSSRKTKPAAALRAWKLLVWVGMFSLPALGAPSGHSVSAHALLTEFARAQDQLRSFIAYYEVNRQDEVFAPQPWRGAHTAVAETRYDGCRVSQRTRLWGRIVRDVVKSRDKPYYKSTLFDGQWRFQYEQPFWRLADVPDRRSGAGTLILGQMSEPPSTLMTALHLGGSGLALGLGVLPHDGERIDVRLREAAALRLRDTLELAGATPSPCYVLEGDTPHGHYTVWLDPARGFQMAKGVMRREAGHKRGSWTLESYERDVGFVEKVRLEKRGGLWIPVEATGGLDNTMVGDHRSSMRFQIKVTRFLLNPDHDALRSFVPDDIRNRAAVYWGGATNANGGLRRCEWQDGRVLDKTGRLVLHLNSGRPAATNAPAGQPRL